MGLDFDAVEYCKNVKLTQSEPPYACPVAKCDRNYKTVMGLQYHLLNYDHDNPQPLTPVLLPNRKKARARGAHHSTPKGPKGGQSDEHHGAGGASGNGQQISVNPESLVTYNDEEKTVQFNIDGKSVRLAIDDPLPFIEDEQYVELVSRRCILNADAPPLEENASWARVQVPEAHYREITDYTVPDAPPRPLAYYRFIEKSSEELDGEIEYDVDEEDTAWLEWMNEERDKGGLNAVSIDTMELLMDRLEKESYFQAAANGTATGVEVDDDAVCCICLDGECQNTNVILFCDMCNLAVHQDCYGVPYIPEGQWLCRRCLQSPSTPVTCVLCPNTGGAFKQTDRSQWAHVVCALWIPEVRFANTVFLEPIDSIETIPAARWRLTCYVCKEKGLGACIQCHRNSCYAAFHVTCAQQAGLYMTMDTVNDGHNDSSVHVQKYAYCHAHTPPDAKLKTNQKEVEDTRHKMKEARKALAKKRSSAPVVLIPTIPPDRVQEISGMVHMQKKSQFLDRLIAYWTLKRQYRNGVPLLRRLQSQGSHHGVIHRNGIEGTSDTTELYKQLKYWQCLRQDLERARLLCELVRKREKLKAAYVKICEQVVMQQLNPLDSALSKLLDALEAKDTSDIFREPVDTEQVPDYLDIVKHPMDLGTMRAKLRQGQYATLEHLEVDFDLMIQNCLAYNNKDTVFYRAGIRMRDQAAPLFVQVRKELEREGLLDNSGTEQPDHVEVEVEDELRQLLAASPCEETVQKMLILADKSQVLKNPAYRTKKIKQIRLEITRMRKAIQKARTAARNSALGAHSHSEEDDDDDDDADAATAAATTTTAAVAHEAERQRERERDREREKDRDHERDRDRERDRERERERERQRPQQHHGTSKRARKPPPANAMSVDEDDDDDNDDDDDTMTEASKGPAAHHTVQTPPCSPIKSLNNSASPVGVNRRTAVLFTRKAQAALKRPSEAATTTPVKEESAPLVLGCSNSASSAALSAAGIASSLATSASLALNSRLGGQLTPLGAGMGLGAGSLLAGKSPKRNARHKRLSEMRHSVSMSPKKSPNANAHATPTVSVAGAGAGAVALPAAASLLATTAPAGLSYGRIPDSFRVYRANNERDVSESDDNDVSAISSPCSSCSDFSMTDTGSEYESSEDDDDDDDDNDNDNEETASQRNDAHRAADGDDDDDDDEEADEEDDDGDGDQGDAEMANAAGGNGAAVSGSADSASDEDADENKADDDGDKDEEEEEQEEKAAIKSIAKRTPTPSENRPLNASRTKKQKKKGGAAAIASAVDDTALTEQSTKVANAGAKRASNHKSLSRRAATPIATAANAICTAIVANSAMPTVNNVKAKRSASRQRKMNNVHNATASANVSVSVSVDSPSPILAPATTTTMTTTTASGAVIATLLKPPLEPLQLVWAKCRGYPWYPALILDPKTPKGFVYNGVPLPAPPLEVLALRRNYAVDEVFLVLFFDAKRTWQWLPAVKLEILGIDKELDQQKLVESRKPTERKAVKKAYQDALHYQSQVSDLEGQGPDPIM